MAAVNAVAGRVAAGTNGRPMAKGGSTPFATKDVAAAVAGDGCSTAASCGWCCSG